MNIIDMHTKQTYVGELVQGLNYFSVINAERGGMTEWTPLEWAGAMCGEAGECANAVKKLRRMELGSASKNNFQDRETAKKAIAGEIAGTLIYLDLLATRLGINLADALIAEFNRVSVREDFPERL